MKQHMGLLYSFFVESNFKLHSHESDLFDNIGGPSRTI